MEEDWNGVVNPMTISPGKGMFLVAIAQHNVVPTTLIILLHILSCFLINMFRICLLLTRTSVQNYKNAGRSFQVHSVDMTRQKK
jgi:hypothetical protein